MSETCDVCGCPADYEIETSGIGDPAKVRYACATHEMQVRLAALKAAQSESKAQT